MDIFCQDCASKPGWPFDFEKMFRHACQRCFMLRPCNDYGWKTGKKPLHQAPSRNEMVPIAPNANAQAELPQAKAKVAETNPVQAAQVAQALGPQTDADLMLDAVYPKRPKIVLEKVARKA